MKPLAACAFYAVGASLTFAFANPMSCGPLKWEYDSLQRAQWAQCAIEQSAINGAVWPIYWVGRLAIALEVVK